MAHLELTRAQRQRLRSEQLIRGLGAFMERESSYPNEDDIEISKSSEPPIPFEQSMSEQVDTPDFQTQRPKATSVNDVHEPESRAKLESRPSNFIIETRTKSRSSNTTNTQRNFILLPTPPKSVQVSPFDQQNLASNQKATSESAISLDGKIALGKAATLIREGTDTDGVGFLDAVPHGFAIHSARATQTEKYLSVVTSFLLVVTLAANVSAHTAYPYARRANFHTHSMTFNPIHPVSVRYTAQTATAVMIALVGGSPASPSPIRVAMKRPKPKKTRARKRTRHTINLIT